MSDEKNPNYIFSITDTALLLAIANGDLDAIKLAKRELAKRGLNQEGHWVGFANAEKKY